MNLLVDGIGGGAPVPLLRIWGVCGEGGKSKAPARTGAEGKQNQVRACVGGRKCDGPKKASKRERKGSEKRKKTKRATAIPCFGLAVFSPFELIVNRLHFPRTSKLVFLLVSEQVPMNTFSLFFPRNPYTALLSPVAVRPKTFVRTFRFPLSLTYGEVTPVAPPPPFFYLAGSTPKKGGGQTPPKESTSFHQAAGYLNVQSSPVSSPSCLCVSRALSLVSYTPAHHVYTIDRPVPHSMPSLAQRGTPLRSPPHIHINQGNLFVGTPQSIPKT